MANVEAMTPCVIYALRLPRFEELAARVPAVAVEVVRAAGAVMAYSFVVAFAIAFVIKKTMGIRISPEDEEKGIDAHVHRDAAYELLPA